jgi:hypothetical protein
MASLDPLPQLLVLWTTLKITIPGTTTAEQLDKMMTVRGRGRGRGKVRTHPVGYKCKYEYSWVQDEPG